MDASNENELIFNRTLAKLIGLYSILNPRTSKLRGVNVYHWIVYGSLLPTIVIWLFLPFNLYYWLNDVTTFLYYIGGLMNLTIFNYIMICCTYNSHKIWKLFDISSLNFLSYQHYDRNIFYNWRRRWNRISFTLVTLSLVSSAFWFSSPYLFQDIIFKVNKVEYLNQNYRMNILNIFMFPSDETYNRFFIAFYCVELTICVCISVYGIIFYLIMITICYSICCQLEMVHNAIELLGEKSFSSITDNILYQNNKSIWKGKNDIHYDELIVIIKDHQKVFQVMEDFYKIFRRPALVDMLVSAISLVVIWSVTIMNLYEGELLNSIPSIKMLIALPLYSFHLLLPCYLFGTVNEKKESIIFALYSSNWTEMKIKSKKLILLAMKMNNANFQKIKFTKTKVVNLQMYAKVIHICYTVCSVLVNYEKNKVVKNAEF